MTFVSRGIQTEHQLPQPPIPLLDDFGFAPTNKFEPFGPDQLQQANYRRLSGVSFRSVYLR